ncbi:MAG: KUP/HAK/KT family potassium transporter [Chitinophagales bacterium]
MPDTRHNDFHSKVSAAGLLIAMGIVFGDIGTSPLYTYTAIFHEGEVINVSKALGVLSAVFWTLLLLTTVKYIFIVLRADNDGEGGIFSLYALVRRYFGKWLIIFAIIGAAFLIADGIITPPISVASAIEGLQKFNPKLNTVPWVLLILVVLFIFQQAGTGKIGKVFGPLMLGWFSFIGIIGLMAIHNNWQVLKALNPAYAWYLLKDYPGGFWLLGGIFLCTTGAEALYSDMGHVGRNNIRWSWMYIKICLVLSYAGQTAWLISHKGETLGNVSPFYNTIPSGIYIFAVIIATVATIIASQALISGCFTLVNEGIQLNIWPRHKVSFPTEIKGQVYISFINWFLMLACIGMVLYFQKSTNMEAAFGLSVTLTMLITSVLVVMYLLTKRTSKPLIILFALVFFSIEGVFLVANLSKVQHGGWITLLIGTFLSIVMYVWYNGEQIHRKFIGYVSLDDQITVLQELSRDKKVPQYVTHLIYLTNSYHENLIEKQSMHSILKFPEKKADIYWFVHINVTDEPYTTEYKVKILAPNDVYHLDFNLGFRIEPKLDLMFRTVVNELRTRGELMLERTPVSKYILNQGEDHIFILNDSYLSNDNEISQGNFFLLKFYYLLRQIAVKKEKNFGIETCNAQTEKYPLVVNPISRLYLRREKE